MFLLESFFSQYRLERYTYLILSFHIASHLGSLQQIRKRICAVKVEIILFHLLELLGRYFNTLWLKKKKQSG